MEKIVKYISTLIIILCLNNNIIAQCAYGGSPLACPSVDINCSYGNFWQVQKLGVVYFSYIDDITGNQKNGSGTLINNTDLDGQQYLLTASHLVNSVTEVNSMCVFFNYENASCAVSSASAPIATGSVQLVATSSTLDFTLLKLTNTIPASVPIFYNGWDVSGIPPANTTTIHHQKGQPKKISIDNDFPTLVALVLGYPPLSMWNIDCEIGSIEPGSSGSPLFDNNKRVIGIASNKQNSNCSEARFQILNRGWNSFPALKAHLDPNNSNMIRFDGYDPTDCSKHFEPNNTTSTNAFNGATDAFNDIDVGFTGFATSYIYSSTDVDYFKLDLLSDGNLELRLTNLGVIGQDYNLELYDATGLIASSNNIGTVDDVVSISISNIPTVYFKVIPATGAVGACTPYKVMISYQDCDDITYETGNVYTSAVILNPPFGSSSDSRNLQSFISATNDKDYYQIGVDDNGILEIGLYNIPSNYSLRLLNINGIEVASSLLSGSSNESITFNYSTPASTIFYIEVSPATILYDECEPYELEIDWTPYPPSGCVPVLGSTTSTNETAVGANNGSASVLVTSGSPPYTYSWSNGGNSSTITGLSAGIYTVTVSGSDGCTNTFSAIVTGCTGSALNNLPCCAEFISVDPQCNFHLTELTTSHTSSGLAIPTCDAPGTIDLWYQFVVPPSGIVNFISRDLVGSIDDIGAAFYSGTCTSLTEINCFKNSLPYNDYMPEAYNVNLSAYIGQTIFLRIWEFGNGVVIDRGPFEFCISESNILCDNTIIDIFETNNTATSVKLGDDNLVTGETKFIQWKAVAVQSIPNAVIGLYNETEEVYKQIISVNAGDTICICPPLTETISPGEDTGKIYSFRVLMEQNTSDLTLLNPSSPLICQEDVKFYTPQIQVLPLTNIIHNNGDNLSFTINKNIQEPVEVWVQNLGTLDSFLVTLSLAFDSLNYDTIFGSCTQQWTIPQNLPEGAYQVKAKGTIHPEIFGRGAFFLIGGCVNPFIALNQESTIALDVLCFIGLIDSIQDSVNVVNGHIPLGEATPLLFNSLYFLNTSLGQELPTDSFPVPFGNLQSENSDNSHYYHEARALYYLNYGNYESALPRNWFYFPDTEPVSRSLAIRMIMEAFDILTPDFSGISPFPDVPANHPYLKWITYASNIGFIQTIPGFNFRPDDAITYEEFYVFLFRALTNYNVSTYIPYHNVQSSDYYTPGNYSLESMPYQLGKTDGVYNHAGSTPFAIPGKGMTLSFSFNYSSAEYDLPIELYKDVENGDGYDFQILGNGWTHNYDARVFHVEDDVTGDERYIFVWQGNQVLTYNPNNSSQPFDAASIYDDVTFLSSGNIEVETKTFVRYIFEPVSGQNFYVLKNIIDKFNNVVTLSYSSPTPDGFLKLLTVSESNNPSRQIQLNYSNSNPRKLASVSENVLNRSVTFVIDNDDNLIAYQDALGSIVLFNYQPDNGQWNHLMSHVTLPEGQIGEILYSGNKLDKYKVGNSYFVDYNWQPLYSNNYPDEYTSCTVTTAANISSTTVKDDLGRMQTYSSPTSDLTITDYDNGNNKMLPTEWNNNGIFYEADYNNKGNVTRNERHSGSLSIESEMTYTLGGKLLQTYEDPEGNTYTYHYDINQALESIELPTGYEYEISQRNASGQVEQVQSPMGITVDYNYNASTGYLESVNNVSIPIPGGAITTIAPDAIGRTTQITDPNGNNAYYTYNDVSQNTSFQNQIGEITSTTYNGNHQATNVTTSKGPTTIGYTTDEAYANAIQFGNDEVSVLYNSDGLPKKINKGPYNATFDYDPTTRQLIQSPGNTYTYNSRFLVETITNSYHGSYLHFTYDELNRIKEVTSIINGKTQKVGYDYDFNSNVTKIYYGGLSSSNIVEYEFDELNRCTKVFDWTSSDPLVEYFYDADSKLLREENRNDTYTKYIYDSGGRLLRIETKNSNNQIICSNTFTLDNAGLHTAETFSVPGSDAATPQFTYSSSNYGPSPYNQTNAFIENNDYNELEFNSAGQVKQLGDLTFDWDMNDRLKRVRNDGVLKAEYKYDGLHHRRWRKLYNDPNFPTVSEVYSNVDIYGMGNVISEEIKHTDGSTDMVYLIHSPNGLVARIFGNATEYFHYDYRGSVLAMTNQNEVITACYNYDNEGLIAHTVGQNYHEQYPNFYTYVGKWGVQIDVERLYFMRARYMFQPMGKFLAQDPVWSNNLYPYANNDPMNFIDPDGNFIIPLATVYLIYKWNKNNKATKKSVSTTSYQSGVVVDALEPTYNDLSSYSTPWMDIAVKELGQSEIPDNNGPAISNPRIIEYHSTAGNHSNDDIAWCASFVNWVMSQAGFEGTNNAWALNWKGWGQTLDEPAYGSIAVIDWPEGGGHVGFVVGETSNGKIVLLGGNQGNMVNYTPFSTSYIVSYQYPVGYIPTYSVPTINLNGNSSYELTR